MLTSIALLALGFLAGVPVTGIIAAWMFGLLREEAAKAVESHGLMLFPRAAPLQRPALPLVPR